MVWHRRTHIQMPLRSIALRSSIHHCIDRRKRKILERSPLSTFFDLTNKLRQGLEIDLRIQSSADAVPT